MKKILLIAALITAVNSFSAITITGGTQGSFSTVANASGGQDLSGTFEFINQNVNVSYDPVDQVLAGTKIQVKPNQTITITNNANGDFLVIQGDGVGYTVYEITQTFTANTIFNGAAPVQVGNQYRCNITGGPICPLSTPTSPIIPTPGATPGVTTPTSGTSDIYIPRSRVNLDLVRNTKSTTYRNMENYKENGYDFNLEYIGGFGGKYKDKSDMINYSSTSNGVVLTGTKNFGSITVGGSFGYQDSKVKYKDNFEGVKEKLSTHQIALAGRYNLTEKTDLTAVMTYGRGKHKFTTGNGLGMMEGAEYTSKIYDFDLRWGTKYGFSNGYIKPYLGFGVTLVDEKEIEKIGAGKSFEDIEYGILGTYGEMNFGKIDLFGNFEYTQRLEKKSYHGKRSYNGLQNIAPLNYSRAEYNLGLGMKYRITDAFNVTANYELDNFKNHVVKLGLGAEF